ncbi:hypothetical protein EDB19DRAFT_1960432 [Suillus lakei]|nr:hypothetical protein EDB19DRAFT_1960432 [Suillus lakei]
MSSPKVWFIMGTSSGFGRSMTEYALNQGNIVVATLRKPQLDVVFNNAGYAIFTEVEGTPVDKVEVNEPGKGGTILQVSSVGVFNVLPGLSYYAATHAVLFLNQFVLMASKQICTIEPGGFHTNVINEGMMLPKHPAYANESFATSVLHQKLDGIVFEGDVEKFTWTIHEVMQGGKIPKWLPMGLDALEMLNLNIENLKATVDETKGWSVDLKRVGGEVALVVPV